eukprot:10776244-Ditylum_brightwellii.AAC.1
METLKTLHNAGGDDNQASLKLYEALVSSILDAFNSEFRTYKAEISRKDKLLDFIKLMTIEHTKYTSLTICGQCPDSPKSSDVKKESH